jgi:hypothetical protein
VADPRGELVGPGLVRAQIGLANSLHRLAGARRRVMAPRDRRTAPARFRQRHRAHALAVATPSSNASVTVASSPSTVSVTESQVSARPPSTCSTAPVVQADSGPRRNRIAERTTSTEPGPRGSREATSISQPSYSSERRIPADRCRLVLTTPGFTEFTRIRYRERSRAKCLVNISRPALLTE